MAEIFGSLVETNAVLEQALRLFKSAKYPVAIERYLTVLDQTRQLIDFLETELDIAEIASPAVASAILEIAAIGNRLRNQLKSINSKRSLGKSGALPLHLRGSAEKDLDTTIKELELSKANIVLRLQLLNVGLTRQGTSFEVNVDALNKIDHLLKEKFGKEFGLRMADLIKDRARNADGTVTLSPEDLESQSLTPLNYGTVGDGSTLLSIRIMNNLASGGLQVNAGINRDVWRGKYAVVIEGNAVNDNAVQINYAIGGNGEAFLAKLREKKMGPWKTT